MKRKQFKQRRDVFIHVEEPMWKEFQDICDDERVSATFKIDELLTEYVKNHKNGNPMYKLDKWDDNPEFVATPAFFEKYNIWKGYSLPMKGKEEVVKHIDQAKKILGILETQKKELDDEEIKEKWRNNGIAVD